MPARSRKFCLAGQGILLMYDEIRQMNSCARCRAKNMTAGELLAWSVGKTAGIYNSVLPGAPLYVWNDMFDPNHNAVNNFYFVEGDIGGLVEGVARQYHGHNELES